MENIKYPVNNKLISLLNIWSENKFDNDYALVMHELVNGNCCLLLPSKDENPVAEGSNFPDKNKSLKLTCIYEVEGLKSIGVFSDEGSLFRWANKWGKQGQTYTTMRSQDVLKLCEGNKIYYMVINSDSPNVFFAHHQINP